MKSVTTPVPRWTSLTTRKTMLHRDRHFYSICITSRLAAAGYSYVNYSDSLFVYPIADGRVWVLQSR